MKPLRFTLPEAMDGVTGKPRQSLSATSVHAPMAIDAALKPEPAGAWRFSASPEIVTAVTAAGSAPSILKPSAP